MGFITYHFTQKQYEKKKIDELVFLPSVENGFVSTTESIEILYVLYLPDVRVDKIWVTSPNHTNPDFELRNSFVIFFALYELYQSQRTTSTTKNQQQQQQ